MIRLEINLGNPKDPLYAEHSIGMHWVDCPDLAQVTDEEWNNNLLVWDQIKNSIHALLGGLGPIPLEGWNIKYWMDSKNLPKSVLETAYAGHWEQRGLVGPPPAKSIEDEKPRKKSPVEEMLLHHECMEFIEKKHKIEVDKRNPRSDSLWLWLMDHDGDALQRESVYYMITNPESPSFFVYDGASEHILKVLSLIHQEFAEKPEDEGVTFWIS